MLVGYIIMNAIAIKKILKKYDKVHKSASGLKSASPKMKCPVCREAGVYGDAVRMSELDLLLRRRFKEQWKERLIEEHAEVTKQTKLYWESQTRYITGI
ncbi:hypothetical protein R6Q57_026872 [Mikania cordata]